MIVAKTDEKMGTQYVRPQMKEIKHLADIPAETLKKEATCEPSMVHQQATNARHMNTKLKTRDTRTPSARVSHHRVRRTTSNCLRK
jgi:hypothetical protein